MVEAPALLAFIERLWLKFVMLVVAVLWILLVCSA
jgi:hypothetical protein